MRPQKRRGGWRALSLSLMLLVLIFGGCTGRPSAEALIPSLTAVPGTKVVTVLVATDRGPDGPQHVSYGSGRAALRYEEFTISVPPGHQSGRIEWTTDTAGDPAKSFVVIRRQQFDERAFREQIASRISGGNTAGIFVHGYNYSLAEAVFRVAQLATDAPSVSVPILFSWPSEAAVTGYVADRDAVTYARDDLAHVLEIIASIRLETQVVLAGHSMGGWLVMETLRQLRLQNRGGVIYRFEVALAAPDIDIDVFRRQVEVVGPLSPPLTILVARDDRALDVSRRLTGGRRRVGTANVDEPFLQDVARRQNLRVVDISSVEASDESRHDRFVRFAAFQSGMMARESSPLGSLQQAGAFIFNAAGAAFSSPFMLVGRALAGH